MGRLTAAAERHVAAPAERVYRCIADFREHHPRFLPPAFRDLEIEAGGVGAGTVTRFTLTLGGRPRSVRTRIDEPESGRVLTETEIGQPAVTTFTVDPDGGSSRVRIETEWQSPGGVQGLVQRSFAPRLLRALYVDELERLEQHMRSEAAPGA